MFSTFISFGSKLNFVYCHLIRKPSLFWLRILYLARYFVEENLEPVLRLSDVFDTILTECVSPVFQFKETKSESLLSIAGCPKHVEIKIKDKRRSFIMLKTY
jgi:hypothetical protein